jgi:hypothetical protein
MATMQSVYIYTLYYSYIVQQFTLVTVHGVMLSDVASLVSHDAFGDVGAVFSAVFSSRGRACH